jgi:glucose/arabinose dehydrogenase
MFVQYLAGGGVLAMALFSATCSDPAAPGPGDPSVPALSLVLVAQGLDAPLYVTAPPGDTQRIFIVEQSGRIRILRNGTLLPTPFLDLSGRISSGGERGLLGLAFHPQYAANRRFVVYYTNPSGDTRVSVFQASSNPDLADAASEQVILAVTQPFANHNGGMVVFGPDGKLYIGLGDGGSGGDPQGNGQNRNVLLGKILRLDVNGSGQASVPADNPFAGQSGRRPEIWSYGLRNPWRFSFDRTLGDLYIGDVGQSAREEIDVSTEAAQLGRGLNYGWNTMEGTACYSPSTGCVRTGLTLPVLDYDHGAGCSVTGGYVYRGAAIPPLRGTYFYGDYCQGWVRSFRLSGTGVTLPTDWASLRPGGQITSFGEDAQGEIYIVIQSGKVLRIVAAAP